jgi:2-dehydropantoate 2-reductase
MGQLLACKLQRAGIAAQLLCRDQATAHRLSAGIELQEGKNHHLVPVIANSVERIDAIHALIITTKANQALAAFRQVHSRLSPATPVVLLHNGMGVYEHLVKLYPAHLLFCGTTTEAAYRRGPRCVVHTGRGETRLGQFTGEGAPGWFSVFADSGQGFYWESDIANSLWSKLLVNCAINPLTAIHRCRNGELLDSPEFREQATRVCAELACVCRARGELQLAERVQEMAFAVMRSTAPNQSSMLQDVLHKRPTEIDFITGYLCQEAKRLQVPCPLNEQLWRQLS